MKVRSASNNPTDLRDEASVRTAPVPSVDCVTNCKDTDSNMYLHIHLNSVSLFISLLILPNGLCMYRRGCSDYLFASTMAESSPKEAFHFATF